MKRMLKVMVIIIWILLQQNKIIDAEKYRGDRCTTKYQIGECKERSQCPIITTAQDVVHCGFIGAEELICCPISNTSYVTPIETPNGLIPIDRFHITSGITAVIGEFPHMAAIGFSRIGDDDKQPYEMFCGGSLIDKRFVLTAAHCFEIHDYEAIIVRLGVVNFTDAVQMSKAVEIRIKNIYEHPEYNIRYKYNDIAIVELERGVETSEFIYPVCLYMNETDPDPEIELWVTGWGHKKAIGRGTNSDSLMKARLYVTPMDHCNSRFIEHGYTKPIPQGITSGIFCAENMEEGIDACQGDSGGPLNFVVNEELKNYRVVGIVNSGISCAGRTPGLYTKVATFLDFIESIVWPNGGD
ncbi:hypothetical protein DOY81_005180 [Sarcophaga bullata]|nr:hypothetical protein DOY81_005180 [Sarcophaga bullata]